MLSSSSGRGLGFLQREEQLALLQSWPISGLERAGPFTSLFQACFERLCWRRSPWFLQAFYPFSCPFYVPSSSCFIFFFYVAPLSKLLFLLIIIMIRMRRGFFNKVLRAAWEKGRSAVSSLVRPCDSPAGVLLYCLSTSWLNATSQELFWRRRCLPVPPRAPPLQHLQRSRAPKPCFLCRSF